MSNEPIDDRDDIATADELAKEWRVPVNRIYAKAMTGEIPSFKIGKLRRFSRRAVREAAREAALPANAAKELPLPPA